MTQNIKNKKHTTNRTD